MPTAEDEDSLASLTPREQAAVRRTVEALVSRDLPFLRKIGAYDDDADPYEWSDHYFGPLGGGVTLIVPPGEVTAWGGGVIRDPDGPTWAGLVVDMWTDEQQGPSDLTLELDLFTGPDDTVEVQFILLHVM